MTEIMRLTVVTGPHRSETFRLAQGEVCTIGRDSGCRVALTGHSRDGAISRIHCRLEVDCPVIHVRDLHSRNGTFINGHQVNGNARAAPGDYLTVGGTTLFVEMVDCSQEEPALVHAGPPEGLLLEDGSVLSGCGNV